MVGNLLNLMQGAMPCSLTLGNHPTFSWKLHAICVAIFHLEIKKKIWKDWFLSIYIQGYLRQPFTGTENAPNISGASSGSYLVFTLGPLLPYWLLHFHLQGGSFSAIRKTIFWHSLLLWSTQLATLWYTEIQGQIPLWKCSPGTDGLFLLVPTDSGFLVTDHNLHRTMLFCIYIVNIRHLNKFTYTVFPVILIQPPCMKRRQHPPKDRMNSEPATSHLASS